MTAPNPTAPEGKPPPLRPRLMDEAMALLEREGAEAITLRSLAAAAGVSLMAPYRHFHDKEALLAALAERWFAALGAAMQAAGTRRAARGDGAGAALLGFGLAYLDFARARPQLYRLMFGPTLAGKTDHAGLQAAGQATYAGLAEAVGAVLARNRISAAEADAHAVATWAMVHGLAMLLLDGRLTLAPRQRSSTASR